MNGVQEFAATVYTSIRQMRKLLLNLDRWLEKAIDHARAHAFDPSILLGAWLAPDQVPLVRQIQNACDSAKYAAARLAGMEAPRHPDTEETIAEIRARIRTCVDYLDGFALQGFHEAASQIIELPFLEHRAIAGDDYLRELALPGFYFHVTTAYAILRNNGVSLNMLDFIGETSLRDREQFFAV
jgi:hypothetical protein